MLKSITNKLICLRAEGIVTGIVSEYKESRVFSILADEDRDDVPKMTRCQFWECESGTSGQELCLSTIVFKATKILSTAEADIPVDLSFQNDQTLSTLRAEISVAFRVT